MAPSSFGRGSIFVCFRAGSRSNGRGAQKNQMLLRDRHHRNHPVNPTYCAQTFVSTPRGEPDHHVRACLTHGVRRFRMRQKRALKGILTIGALTA